MPKQVIITDRKFYNQLKNGLTFASNTSDYTTNLVGAVGENIQMVANIDVEWWAGAINGDSFTFIAAGHVRRQYGSFIEDGFAIGDTFDYCPDLVGGSPVFNGTITFITDLDVYYTVNSGSEPSPATVQTNKYFRGLTTLDALQYRYGLIENDEATNYFNKVTGNEQVYSFTGVSGGVVSGLCLNGVQTWNTGSITCEGLGATGYTQSFEVVHTFTILPYYADGYDTYLGSGTLPPLFAGSFTLKYVSEAAFRVVYSNPNGEKSGVDDLNRGSVGFFGENFNGRASNWSIDSITYHDDITGLPVDSIQAGRKTRVTIIALSTDPAPTDDRWGLVVSKASNVTASDLSKTFAQNYLLNTVVADIGAAPATNDYIIDYEAYYDSADTIFIQFWVEFSTPQKAQITDADSFVIGVIFDDTAVLSNDSKKVMLLADYLPFTVDNDVTGLLEWVDNRYYNHTQVYPDTTDDLSKSQHDYKGWIEDGVLNNFKFKIDVTKGGVLSDLKMQFVAYNTLDDTYFPIQSHVFNLAYGTIAPVGGYDAFQIDISSTRGYNLPTGDQFNLVKLKSDTQLYGNWLYYDVVLGFKVDWQKWIKNFDADPSFTVLTELFKGLNQYSAQYKSGYWELRCIYTATMDSGIAVTNYELLSPEITIRKYDVDGNTPPKWVGVITTHTEDGTQEITPYVLSNAKTLFKTVWTWNSGVYGTMSDNFQSYVGIHRIEPHYSPTSSSIEEFSSLRFNLNEKLKPVSGSTLLKVEVGVNTITTKCIIDYKQLDKINYKLSSRLYALVELLGLTWEDINVQWEEISLDWEVI